MRWNTLLAVGAAWVLAGTAAAADFPGAVLATPLPPGPGTFVPGGGPLAAPVITPIGIGKCGDNLFEVIPAGWNRDPFSTRDPGKYIAEICGNPACPNERVGWLNFEYLYWATQGPAAPPLVTSGSPLLAPGLSGLPGGLGSQTLLGGDRVLNMMRSGFRITGGAFIDNAGEWAVSHQLLVLPSRSERVVGGSDGTNVVAVPQAVPTPLGPVTFPLYVGYPGLAFGTVASSVQTSLFGGDTNLRRVFQSGDSFRLDLLGGYRFLHLGDSIATSFDTVATGTAAIPGLPPGLPGTRLMGEDSVRTRNDFHGAEFGFSAMGRQGQFTLELQASLAMGVTVSNLDQSHTRSVFAPLGLLPGLPPPGVPLTQLANHNTSDYFAVVPEVGIKVGWQPVQHFRLTVGYDFLYWSRVRRAEEVYALSPVLRGGTTDFWAQGLTLGAEFRY